MKHLKKIIPALCLLFGSFVANSQGYFLATIRASGTNLELVIKPRTGGGNITTDFSLFEFFIRIPASLSGLQFGAPVSNTTDFPNLNLQHAWAPASINPPVANMQGTESGYNNYWFIGSLSTFTTRTYTEGIEYLVATIPILISGVPTDPKTINGFEMVNNTNYVPHYLTLTSATGGNDLTARVVSPTEQVFYASGSGIASSCDNSCGAGAGSINLFVTLTAGTLPVNFTRYDVTCSNAGALLRWSTAGEQNSKRFEIQRSENGNDWITIDQVAAAGTTTDNRQYQYLDATGGAAYYRVKQVDQDGHATYTAIRRTECRTAGSVSLFPVPARDKITLVIRATTTTTTELRIQDMSGRIVRRTSVKINKGNNNIVLGVEDLAVGQYLLTSVDPSLMINKTFTINR